MKPRMAKPSRRDVLKAGAGISLMIGAGGVLAACSTGEEAAVGANEAFEPNIWVTIAGDGTTVIRYAGTEMGQGSETAVPLVLAEEMDADWSQVVVETVVKHDTAYDNPIFGNMLYTAGSATMEGYFMRLRLAGAQARKLLIMAAANYWQVPADEVTTAPGAALHQASGRRLGYGDIARFAALPATWPQVSEADLKPASAFRLIGKDVPRRDIPAKTRGEAVYGLDVQVPGMAYASIERAPVEGETPLKIDDAAARAIAGVVDVVALEDGVAVVGETYEAALAGRAALRVEWSTTSPLRAADSARDLDVYAAQARDLEHEATPWQAHGDVAAALAGAARVISAEYRSDYTYHAQMEPMNCTAWVKEDGKAAEIWVGSQTQSLTILGAAQALGTTPDKITLHLQYLGGGFGRRSQLRQLYVDDALFVSRAVGRPVKVIWSREDDVRTGMFRPISAHYLRAGLDQKGQVVAWHHRVATPSVLAYVNPVRWKMAEGRDVISMLGTENSRYRIDNALAEHVIAERRARIAPWRGVGAGYNKFAGECFVDELAAATDADPIAFRRRLCGDNQRDLRILDALAEMSDWARPRDGTALGVALAGYKTSAAGCVVEVSVDRNSGAIRVHKVWAVTDPGLMVAPRNVAAQVEGNIVWGISAALRERVTIAGGEVQQSNFFDYEIMRMAEMPDIEVKLLPSDAAPTAVGELGLPMMAPAIANAVARLTGARLRHLPLLPERVLAALKV